MKPHHDAETGQITGDSLVVCPSCGWVNLFRVAHIPERYLVPGSNPPRMKDFDVTMLLDLYPHTMARRYAKKFAEQRQKGMGLIFHGANGSGKCVDSSDVLTLADGARVTAGSLIGKSFSLLALENGEPHPVHARAEFNAIEPIWELETESGRKIRRNGRHPLWTGTWLGGYPKNRAKTLRVDGWTAISEIEPGCLVAVTRELPAFAPEQSSDLTVCEAAVLGYLIGDGCLTNVSFCQAQGPQLEEFCSLVVQLGCEAVQSTYDPLTWRVVANRGIGSTMKGGNPIRELVRRTSIYGLSSSNVYIPDAVFHSSKEVIATFLSRLFSADGWATTVPPQKGQRWGCEIGFTSISERLARDVQHLLVRFGIRSNLFRKRVAKSRTGEVWTVSIRQSSEVIAFADRIGIFGKEDAVAKAREVSVRRLGHRCSWKWRERNITPGTVWEKVKRVEVVGVAPTVAIEVPDGNTYLSDFYEHNTFLASMVAMKVVMQGYSVRFATFGKILRELHESYNAKQEVLSPLVRYQRCDLLVLDDLGAEQITAHSVAQLFILLNERMNELKPTVVTTNLRPEEMGDALASDPVQGRRLADRLTGLSYPLEVRTNTSVRYIERDRALEELMGDDQ